MGKLFRIEFFIMGKLGGKIAGKFLGVVLLLLDSSDGSGIFAVGILVLYIAGVTGFFVVIVILFVGFIIFLGLFVLVGFLVVFGFFVFVPGVL